jgi:uncharacterized protein YndB with AHSA1/START domain
MATEPTPTGLTKDVGWEIGVSRTLPLPLEEVWSFLTSPDGTAVWLDEALDLPTTKGEPITTRGGAVGELRSHRPGDRVRLIWRPAGWSHDTTLQVAVSGGEDKTTIRFHQEHLADADERERQRAHWQGVIQALADRLPGDG